GAAVFGLEVLDHGILILVRRLLRVALGALRVLRHGWLLIGMASAPGAGSLAASMACPGGGPQHTTNVCAFPAANLLLPTFFWGGLRRRRTFRFDECRRGASRRSRFSKCS